MEYHKSPPPSGHAGPAEAWTVQELSAINEVAAAVSRHLELEDVLQMGLDAALRALGLDKGWIRLYNDAGDLVVRAVRGLGPQHVDSLMLLQETEGVCGAAIAQGESVVIHGAPEDPAEIFPSLKRHGFSSYLGTPLMLHGKVRGILVVTSIIPFRFMPRQVGLLKIIAGQLAIAIEHALLYDEISAGRQRRENELESSRRFVQGTIDAVSVRICVLDGRGTIIFQNQASLGGAGTEACGLGDDYVAACEEAARQGDETAARMAAGVRAVMSGEREEFSLEYARQEEAGERRHYEVRITALPAAGRRQAVIAHHDVTEMRRAEEESRRALDELRALDRLKDDFVSGITHDLKTPLVPAKGFIDILLSGKAGPLTEKQRLFLTYAESAVAREADMIDDLLEASLIQAGQLRLEPQPLDLRDVLTDALQFLDMIARDKQLSVSAELATDALPVMGEARKLSRIFNNLFTNAVRYNEQGGAVRVRAWSENERVLVSVSDTGVGIAPEQTRRIFERFYQVPGRHGGAGLGLSVVKELTRLHGGGIEVRSELGKGSTFTVALPRSPEPAPA